MPDPDLLAAAIVLAGGRSERFGADKLAVDVDGAPLLHHALRTAATICEQVLVVGAPAGLPVEPPPDLRSTPLVLRDADAYPGPLVALMRGVAAAQRDRVLLLGGDMPSSELVVLRRLLEWDAEAQGACLVADGWVQPLPMGLDREAVLDRGTELVAAGERSLRSLIDALTVELVLEEEWRALDPDGHTLRDIDRPADLSDVYDR